MLTAAEIRRKLGNGHWAWLENLTPPWEFIKRLGQAKEGEGHTVLEAFDSIRTTNMYTNRRCCEDLKKEFEEQRRDSYNYDMLTPGSPWYWTLFGPVMMQVIPTMLQGVQVSDAMYLDFQEVAKITSRSWYANYHVWICGSQVFSISSPLAAKLLLTDCSRVQWQDLHLPFPAFVIQIPPDLITLIDPSTGKHALDTILVVDGHTNGERRLDVVCMAQENEKSVCLGDDSVFHYTIKPGDPSETFGESVDQILAEGKKYKNMAGVVRIGGASGEIAARQLPLFTLAVILYLGAHPEDKKRYANPEVQTLHNRMSTLKGRKRQAAGARLKKLLAEPRPYLVGTHITIDPNLHRAARAFGSGEHHEVTVASYVRGHQRMQAYGTGRLERRLIWIEPYWRGIESPTKTQKTYEVK